MGETIARGRALAQELDRSDYLLPLISGQWAFHFVRAEYNLALSLAEQLEKLGETRSDVTAQLKGRRIKG